MRFDLLFTTLLEFISMICLFYENIVLFLVFHTLAVVYFCIKHKIKKASVIIYSLLLPFSALLFIFETKKDKTGGYIEQIDSKKIFLLDNIKPIKRTFGESTVHSLINNQNADSDIRLRAFIILTELITPETVLLLKKGLSDKNDEIRLLCYSVLNTIEKNIQNKIHETAVSDLPSFEKNKTLAKLNNELIYLNLADKEFKNFILNEIHTQINSALKEKNDTELLKFKAKIYMYEKEYEKAYKIYKNLKEEKDVIPYLLEIYYYKKEYSKIKEYLKKYPYIKYYDKFYNIYRFWNV